jgi:hypothetical protein
VRFASDAPGPSSDITITSPRAGPPSRQAHIVESSQLDHGKRRAAGKTLEVRGSG